MKRLSGLAPCWRSFVTYREHLDARIWTHHVLIRIINSAVWSERKPQRSTWAHKELGPYTHTNLSNQSCLLRCCSRERENSWALPPPTAPGSAAAERSS